MSLVRSIFVTLASVLPSCDSRKSTFCSCSLPFRVMVTVSNVGKSLGFRGPTSTVTSDGRSYCAWIWRWIFAFTSGEIFCAEHPAHTSSNNRTDNRFISKLRTASAFKPELRLSHARSPPRTRQTTLCGVTPALILAPLRPRSDTVQFRPLGRLRGRCPPSRSPTTPNSVNHLNISSHGTVSAIYPSRSAVMNDIRIALRQLRKSPGFALTVILTIALGIGANTAIFTLVHAILLKSLPVADPKTLYRIGDKDDCCVNGGFQND